jgi:uncharacterized protein (TIGR03437 family)
LRGTEVRLDSASATLLSFVRLRWNMNAVRLRVDADAYLNDSAYRAKVGRVLDDAHLYSLTVILNAPDALSAFWNACRRDFHGEAQTLCGADTSLTDVEFACPSAEADPSELDDMVEQRLSELDRQGVSWIASSFTPGKLVTDERYFNVTSPDNGFPCGIGMAVQFHLWHTKVLGLFTVNANSGTLVLARGGFAVAYGPTMTLREGDSMADRLPKDLQGTSVRVTDAKGVVRLAGVKHVVAGWSQVNFVVPPDVAGGPAIVEVVRADGSAAASHVEIADVSPALKGAIGNGSGPAMGTVTRRFRNGEQTRFAPGSCTLTNCTMNPIVVSDNYATEVTLIGNGFRNAPAKEDLNVRVCGVAVPVLRYGAFPEAGVDQVIVALPNTLRGRGECDVTISVDGRISNTVRLEIR